jgi:3-methylcrotonyl-CoA carboxylase beta subunit
MSSEGLPQVAVVHGITVAGGAYTPAMADEVIIVRNQGTIFLAGPPLVKAATGEVIDDESLGGGLMHSTESGVTDHLALDDEHAIVLARQAIANSNFRPPATSVYPESFDEPLYDPAELHGIVSADIRRPFPMKDVIARLVDGSQMHEFKKEYGPTLITGFGACGMGCYQAA